MNASDVLKSLGIEPTNPGACGRGWITGKGTVLESINPTNGRQSPACARPTRPPTRRWRRPPTRRSSRGA